MRLKYAPLVVVYLCMSCFTYATLLANIRGMFPDIDRDQCRFDMGMSALYGLLPPAWVLAPFLSGFYEHGLELSCLSARERDVAP